VSFLFSLFFNNTHTHTHTHDDNDNAGAYDARSIR
jgi:hypothetical protein